eukprot:Gregarina_sp_Pseudo_9__2283@NODE_2607_length_938_cov_324_011123_g2391_i0_p1_GENE_NODE_2607_length_938_cov_324_011123_g2391_i0NODE_2607_length_938_cov_324_011123_g2391_i0_p1_ORF_typecomplete_len246_score87_74EF1_GNE/PF00736_19/3e16Rtf2/PF04641_12/0_0031SOGA/PF11365_8/0_056Stm1_N/PF09598_10/0_61_NODE_2607_length_938_cov_324_011123_g2391_i0111848
MAVDFGNVKSDAGLSALNAHMLTHSYVEGFCASEADSEVFAKLVGVPNAAKFPAASRWWRHIASFSDGERAAWSLLKGESAHKEAAKDEDDIDLFGDDKEEEDLAAVMAKRAAAKKADEAAKSEKKKKEAPVGKSTVTLEIRATSSEVDLNELAQKIKEVQVEGLQWTQKWEIKKLFFGLSALILGCVIIDELVPLDTITRSIMCVGLSPEMAAARTEAIDAGVDFDEEDECLVKSVSVISFVKL